jgi:hypothetical protein
MSKREKISRVIAAVIVTLLTTAFVYSSHVKRASSKEQFMAAQSQRYDKFFQKPSLLSDFQVAVLEVGTTVILYEALARFLMKIVRDRP